MSFAEVNGVRIYYEIHGHGEPLLLVAGLASDSQSWLPILEDLAQNYRVITFDNRGVGRTTPMDVGLTIHQIADDCVGLIEHLGLPRVHLLGHSMGGFIAQECAIRYSEYVDRLILAATSTSISERTRGLLYDWVSYQEWGMEPELWFRGIFYWLFSARFFEDREAVAAAIQYAVEYPYPQSAKAFRNQATAIAKFNCSRGLAKVTSKTLVIFGNEDQLFPAKECTQLFAAIPDAEFSLINDAAHSIHIENPMAFTRCVLDFLSAHG